MTTNRSACWKLGAIVLLFFSVSCALAQTPGSNDGPATRELKRLVAADPEFKRLLVASIEQAKQVNPDRSTNPAQSLEQYYEFISWAERALPGDLLKQKPNATLYQRLDQSLGYLYYICDQPLDELKGRGFFNNSLQYVEPFASWNRSFVRSWGAFLNSSESWNKDYLRLAQADATFGLDHGWYEDPSHWKTFNQFFARRLKSPSQRPIEARTDTSVLVSPVDAVPQGLWAIDKESRVIEEKGIAVKTGTVQSVAQLIGDESKYKNAFAGGTFTHLFLDVGDYHRYHFPLGGVVREVRVLPGSEVAGGYVTWDSVNRRYAFDPSSIGWQSLETRGLLILETDDFGLVALLPIGMSPVSSVNFDPALKEGVRVEKGDMLGHFLFGGSDFVMVFQAGVTLTPASPRNEPGGGYSHVLMGQRLGELRHVFAQAKVQPPTCPGPIISSLAEAEQYIRASEDEWAKSVGTNDASVVSRILAEDFVWVLNGRVLDKRTAVAEAAEGPGPFLSNTADYVHVRFFGATAVAQGSETWTKTGGRRGQFIWTDTWVNRGGCWQIVNAQDTIVPLAS